MSMPTFASPAPPSLPEELILRDVVAEHLDEAAFLSTQWEQALVSPAYKFAEVRDRVESRLLAHVDGLVVGGTAVADRLLKPALWEGTPDVTFAAALALLSDASLQSEAAVLSALKTAPQAQVRPIVRALELCPSPRRESALLRLVSGGPPQAKASAARILGFQGADLGQALPQLLDPQNEQLLQVGLYCLRYRPRPEGEPAIRQSLNSASESLMTAALLAAAVAGLQEVLPACRACLQSQHPATPTAALLLGFLGSQSDTRLLRQSVAKNPHAAAVILALGLAGERDTADACVEWLRTPALAVAASEAFLAISGADAEKEQLLQPARTQTPADPAAEEQDTEPSSQPDVPLLSADAVAPWWQKRREEYSPATRYFAGKPRDWQDAAAWLAVLEQATMRQRHHLALAMAVNTPSRTLPQTFSLGRR